ncbi:MAG: ATP-binding protein [Chloroflexi bacterium]|nr:ATP-binding protein [Chloroflexota bacterium]MDA8236882.1 ATP-binding protein [Chloroflexota bacterium]
MGRLRLRGRLLASHLLVVVVGTITLVATVGVVAPGALDMAMGHVMTDSMNEAMAPVIRQAFSNAIVSALVVAATVAGGAAVIVSVLVSSRLARRVARLAAASRRIADGRYAERVSVTSDDEIGELAASFNRMAESLESTERRRLQLVGDVAHELRTPLATLEGYLEGLQDGVIRASEPTWDLLHAETARLARLVNDLQELWRAEARQVPLTIAAVDVEAMLAAAVDRFSPKAAEGSVDLRLAVSPGVPTVRADADRLAQVLDNLVSNALRYAPAGSRVIIGAGAAADRIRLFVEDEGPGLTAEQRERVFERFYRVDPSRSRALGGSGIGLAIARALVDAMGGRIWAESEGPDHGTTFVVEMPHFVRR